MTKLPQKNFPTKIRFKKNSLLSKLFNKNHNDNSSENYTEMVENFYGKIKSSK